MKFTNPKNKIVKFVLISRARSGSNLLMTLLDSHPQIKMHGEVFKRVQGLNSIDIWNSVFSKKNKVIGFKLFYYHPIDENDKKCWEYIHKDQSVRIIHLIRKNYLRTYVSRKIADKTNLWSSIDKNAINFEIKKVKIEIPDLLKSFKETDINIEQTNNFYSNHEKLIVFYEDLVEDRNSIMDKCFNFLNVKSISSHSDLKKQNPEKLDHLIVNYHEVYDALIDTKYEFMLENDS